MREFRTEIEINATPDKVWDVLMDFDSYPEWNPFMQSASGKQNLWSVAHDVAAPRDRHPSRKGPYAFLPSTDRSTDRLRLRFPRSRYVSPQYPNLR